MSIVTSLFSVIPSNVALAYMDMDAFPLFGLAVAIIAVIGLFVLLVFKADMVVQLLKLDKGFDDEKIELGNLNSTEIVKIGTFIIGGLLILGNIPEFISLTLITFKRSVVEQEYYPNDKFNWAYSGIKIFLGYLLLTNYSFVARLLKTRREN